MDSRIPFSHPPRSDVTPGLGQNTMDGVRRSTPAWNREELIGQFQRIDGCTRIEAERQIADLEQCFRGGIGDVANGEALQAKRK